MMKKYLIYEIKKSIWPTIILTLIGALIYIPTLMMARFVPDLYNPPHPRLGTVSFVLCAFCILVPIYELSYQKKKRSIDQLYSLPIKRTTLITSKFVSGFTKIFIAYTFIFFLGLLVIISKENPFYLGYYFPFYFISVLLGLSLYAFISFIYSRANTIIDGIIFIFFYMFILLLIIRGIDQLYIDMFRTYPNTSYENFFPFSPMINLTEFYTMLIRYGGIVSPSVVIDWVCHLIWTVIGILSIIGLIFSTKIDKAERAEQISDSYFGYRVLIPLYLVLIIYVVQLEFYHSMIILTLALLFGAGLTLFIIYRRTFKLPWKYWIIFAGSIILGLFLVAIL